MEIKEIIKEYFNILCKRSDMTPRERDVLRLRYGIDDGRKRTHNEIAQVFNVSIERIRQIEHRALKKAQKVIEKITETKKTSMFHRVYNLIRRTRGKKNITFRQLVNMSDEELSILPQWGKETTKFFRENLSEFKDLVKEKDYTKEEEFFINFRNDLENFIVKWKCEFGIAKYKNVPDSTINALNMVISAFEVINYRLDCETWEIQ